MLRRATWRKLARERELLCGDCVLQRASEQGIGLTFADLKPCPFNLFGSPSWFGFFGGDEIVKQP